jgi:hypothetical protein
VVSQSCFIIDWFDRSSHQIRDNQDEDVFLSAELLSQVLSRLLFSRTLKVHFESAVPGHSHHGLKVIFLHQADMPAGAIAQRPR